MVLQTRSSLPWATAPSAIKRPSANLWIARSSLRELAKTCGSVFPIRGRVVAIMEQSSSVPNRSIKTPLSRGKRPKSFTAPNTAGSASRKSAKCSGNVEEVDGFCASSVLYFKEATDLIQIVGILFVFAGVWFISQTDHVTPSKEREA